MITHWTFYRTQFIGMGVTQSNNISQSRMKMTKLLSHMKIHNKIHPQVLNQPKILYDRINKSNKLYSQLKYHTAFINAEGSDVNMSFSHDKSSITEVAY